MGNKKRPWSYDPRVNALGVVNRFVLPTQYVPEGPSYANATVGRDSLFTLIKKMLPGAYWPESIFAPLALRSLLLKTENL